MADSVAVGEIHELSPEAARAVSGSPYYNEDIAPVPAAGRKWGTWDIAALWIGMAVCIPTYMLASSLMAGGMNWWQAVLTVGLGNLIVLVPMVLNAHAGTKYGIPFPVFARASFGLWGANIPAILRAIVACGWFGIQTWIGGWAIYKLLAVYIPSWETLPPHFLGINFPQWICFLAFWFLNIWIVWRGMESLRHVEDWGAPLLLIIGLAMLAWAYVKAGGFGPIFTQPSQFVSGGPKEGGFWTFFFPALTGMVGFWATLSLNIPDFTRYARSQKDQIVGQALGLNTTMPLYAFIGVAVTSAAFLLFEKNPDIFAGFSAWVAQGKDPAAFKDQLWDPVFLMAQFKNPLLIALSMFSLTLATLTTNLAANVVAPANSFSNIAPRKISFRTGGLITGVIGILMMPWKLVQDPSGYIFTWLIGYSALLGPIAGAMIADYFLVRRTNLNLADLYRPGGSYPAVHWPGVTALLLGILPNLPGFLATIGLAKMPAFWTNLYHYAWFVGFAVGFLVYLALAGRRRAS